MKACIKNLKRVLRLCADAHNCDFDDWSDEGQLGVWSITPATICDVQLVLDSFYGNHDAIEVSSDVGCTTIWLDEDMDKGDRDVDMMSLSLALPYGTELE